MKELERMAGLLVIEVIWRRKAKALALGDLELWIVGAYFSGDFL